MDNFDQSEPLPWLAEPIDEEELQRFIESLKDSLNEDNPPPLPSLNNEDTVVSSQLPDAMQEPVIDGRQSGEETELGNLSLVPFDCSVCTLLREVVHTNGLQNARLAIHGGLGVFYHAMLEVTYTVDGWAPAMESSFIDLSSKSFEQIKKFLIDYALVRVHNGYVLVQDSTSSFYDVLCVSMNFDTASTSNNGSRLNEQGLCQSNPTVAVNEQITTEKTGMSAQRERTANLRISDFADYFHLRILDASKEIGICPTALKKICRKYGMRRWPYRKVKSIDNKIKGLQDDLLARRGEGAVRTQEEIEKLRAQRARICGGLQPSRIN